MGTPQRDSVNLAPTSNGRYASPRSSMDSMRSPSNSSQTSLRISSHPPSTAAHHRQSFDRGYPSSPRSHRQPSLSSIAVQELIDNPPIRPTESRFAGRDWKTVKVGELINPDDLKFVDVDTAVETATNLLIDSEAPILLIRDKNEGRSIVGVFDYNTLNAYLLMVLGLAPSGEDPIQDFVDLGNKAREGEVIPVRDVKDLGRREPLSFLPESADLQRAIEEFGQGVHRVIITKEGSNDIVGVLSQSRLVKFLWENGRSFPALEQVYSQYLRDLRIGSNSVVSVNGDRPLIDALALMSDEGISSVAVVDNALNVVGNISTVDVKLLTKSSALPLLRNTCIHFISVILSTRGMFEGKDSFPVFHVSPLNTLAHTVAKLVATKSHRMWVTEPMSPMSSGPPTPSLQTATMVPLSSHNSSISSGTGQHHVSPPAPQSSDQLHVADASLKTPVIAPSGPSISASSLPGARISGRLVGVVSLTDILICFARAGGMDVADPSELRTRRRRSSSSSVRRSIDLGVRPRPSFELRPPTELQRKNSSN